MREAFRNEMLSSMFEDVIEVNTGHSFQSKQKQPEQQEQRIWEIDSDEEEKEEKKRAKNKRKYLRKKEKAQAEKAELQQQKSEENDAVSQGLAGMSIQDAPTVSTDEHQSSSGDVNTEKTTQPKLSKRQKKTLLKKAKQAQTAVTTPELGHYSSADDTSDSNHVKLRASKDDESDKENKAGGIGHEKQDEMSGGREDEVATESEVEAVMETIARRFGQ
jgi:hypothetical protein